MADVLSFHCHLARVGEPADQLSPCITVEVARSPSTICCWFSTLSCYCVYNLLTQSGFATSSAISSEGLLLVSDVSLLNKSFSNCIVYFSYDSFLSSVT